MAGSKGSLTLRDVGCSDHRPASQKAQPVVTPDKPLCLLLSHHPLASLCLLLSHHPLAACALQKKKKKKKDA
jgi:hypothetical protein